jgi:hypothetical protein
MTTPTRPRSTAANVFLRPSGTDENFVRLTVVIDRNGAPVPPPGIPARALNTYNDLADNLAAGNLSGIVTDSTGRKLEYEFGPSRIVLDVNDATPDRPALAPAPVRPAANTPADVVRDAFRRINTRDNVVSLYSLRRAAGLETAAFDSAVDSLRRSGFLALSAADRFLSSVERSAGIHDSTGDLLTHASAR